MITAEDDSVRLHPLLEVFAAIDGNDKLDGCHHRTHEHMEFSWRNDVERWNCIFPVDDWLVNRISILACVFQLPA